MKKIMTPLLTWSLFLGSTLLHADKKSEKTNITNSETMTIVDKGVKRTVPVNKLENKGSVKSLSAKSNKENKKGLLLRFKKGTDVDIKILEEKYSLKLKSKMKIGYYIFENNSNESDVSLMARIIENESDIDSVKPNWKKRNTPR